MKKVYVALLILGVSCVAAKAQNVLEGNNNSPIKFEDAIKAYLSEHGGRVEDKSSEAKQEGSNYHFDRWRWYWEQHLDENGYMVSPTQNFLEAQKLRRSQHKTTADQSDWGFKGPTTTSSGYRGIGRINCIEFHPTNKDEYWVGSAGGGAWKTTNDGVTWVSTTQDLPVLGVSDIDINPLNSNTIYLCPGDRDGSDTYSVGVLKSTDGGNTWDTTGLQWNTSQFRLTNCLVINPIDTNSLTLATSVGIYKSYDGGQNWTYVQGGHYKQVIYKPGDTSVLYAPRYNNNREIYRSTDGGANWSVVTNFNNARRIQLAVTPQDPSIVKAVVCNSANGLMGIYHSSNSGASFTQIYAPAGNCNGNLISGNPNGTGCGRQGWYDLTIAINPSDSNEVYVGGVNTWRSTNGGKNWNIANQWSSILGGVATVHADKHMHAYNPLVPGRLFECNDGGIYKSDAPQSMLWTDVTYGMGITQFYRNAVTDISTSVLGGSQDNGSMGLQGGIWYELTGGDGMECQADPLDSMVFYTAIQNGELRRTTTGGFGFVDIQDNIPGKPTGGWITPYIISPHNNQHLIAGYRHIYFSPDRGDSWMSIQGSQLINKNALRVAQAGHQSATVFAIYPNESTVYYTKNFVPNSTTTFDTLNVPFSGRISDIKVHPTDSMHFWLSFSGYNSPQFVEYNQGVWTQNNTGLPNVPVRSIEFDSARNVLYVGTDIAVYYNDTSTNNVWASYRKNMPNIEIADLAINYNTKLIWAATYGRGMWSSPLQGTVTVTPPPDTTDTTNSVAIVPYTANVFSIMPNPNKGSFKVSTDYLSAGDVATISIIDMTGKVIYRKETEMNGGAAEVVTGGIPAGIYIVELRGENDMVGRKRMVVR